MIDLYYAHAEALREAREAQRRLVRSRPRIGDLEAELTYLLIRDRRPQRVVQVGRRDCSASWLRRALADNGEGELHAYDVREPDTAAIDLLVIEPGHAARHLLDRLRPGTVVRAPGRPALFGAGRSVLGWLAERGIRPFSTAAPDTYAQLIAVKRLLGLDRVVHRLAPDPTLFCTVSASPPTSRPAPVADFRLLLAALSAGSQGRLGAPESALSASRERS